MRTGIACNLKSDLPPSCLAEDAAEEFDLPETIEAIADVLKSDGHEVFLLGGDLEILQKIHKFGIEFVFNIAEGFQGRSREAHIPALLELLNLPYSGSDPLGLALTLDKALTKRVALSLGIRTPEFWVAEEAEGGQTLPALNFPLFVKPLWQGSSKGVRRSSKVLNPAGLGKEIKRLSDNYPGEPVLVEEYIPGREFTVGILGNENPEVMGIMEIAPKDPGKDFYYSLEMKRNWKEDVTYHCPPRLEAEIQMEIERAAVQLFKELRLRDVARFDFRMDPEGRPYFLEVNPLPGLSPESGDLVILAQKKGWSYRELILKITHSAMDRYPELKLTRKIAGDRHRIL